MESHSPVISLATVILLTEDLDPPGQSGLLCHGARPHHGLLPAVPQEGVEVGPGEDNLGQEGDLTSLGPGGVQPDVARLVQTHRAVAAAGEEAGDLGEVTAVIELGGDVTELENIATSLPFMIFKYEVELRIGP